MDENLRTVVDNRSVAHQEAIVKRFLKPRTKEVTFVIPGGAKLLDNVSKPMMADAVYNWIRFVSEFNSLTLSFAKEDADYPTTVTKVQDFPKVIDGVNPWVRNPEGRSWLAKQIAHHINTRKFLALQVKPEGIFVIEDTSKKFNPLRSVTKEEIEASGGLLDKTSKVTSEDWQPHIVFVTSTKSEYTV